MKSLEERFRSKIRKDNTSECILWTAAIDAYGYGAINGKGKMLKAHRVAWELAYGPIPEGLCVLHKCDVRNCVNVEHLFIGTDGDNVRDMLAKGRAVGNKKLSKNDIINIRADNRYQKDIAHDYNVTQALISCIKTNKIWKYISNS